MPTYTRLYRESRSSWTQHWKDKFDMTRHTSLAVTLALLLSAPLAQAIDTAPAGTLQGVVATRAVAPLGAVSLKVDEYKETDVWGRIRSGYAIPDISNSL